MNRYGITLEEILEDEDREDYLEDMHHQLWMEEQSRLDYEEKYVINEDLEPDYDNDTNLDEIYWDNDGQDYNEYDGYDE